MRQQTFGVELLWRISGREGQLFSGVPGFSPSSLYISLACVEEQEMPHTAAAYPGGLLIFRGGCFGMNSRAASCSCREFLCGKK